MALLKAITQCFGSSADDADSPVSEKPQSRLTEGGGRRPEEIASDVLTLLMNAEKKGPELDKTLNETVGECGWTEDIAAAVWNALINLLKNADALGKAMKDAFERATEAAVNFAHDHPAYTALIALGILVILSPWIIQALGFCLGFGELGPVEGSLAALWQSRYAGYVPKGSLFSFFQRLGMIWK